MSKEVAQQEARERLALLRRADAFLALLQQSGWKLVCDFFEGEISLLHSELQQVDTGKLDVAIAALQRWQLAQKIIGDLDTYIQTTLAEAEELRGGLTLEDGLLMEQLNEQQRAGDPGRTDPTGHF